ncbi:site-specific tyrosine recombinase XerD [Kordia sp. SMS9]|uniref:site-specific integrase n=1 Tax=Kordia sp. SMS9 TaxID=2282170 RepID=UPI000E0DC533|nr:site-specific integrase [Kordia sp. SMS9]AXG70570.1 site-specific tyrosine recombinase XerD [Kordia sp. SMS9]
MASIKILLWKHDKKKNNTFPLAIRITKNRKTRYVFTGEYIKEKDWNEKEGLVKKSHPNSARLNNFLQKKLSEAHSIALDVETTDKSKTVKSIKKKIVNDNNADFFSIADMYLKNLEERKKFNQSNNDNGRLEIFKIYLGKEQLDFMDLDVTLLDKFKTYLIYKLKRSERTVANYMILIRTIYNMAIAQGVTDKNNYPFGRGKYQIKIPESEKIGLNREEIQLLENVDNITPAQQHALNVWLFSFYFAGIRVGDVLKLKWSDFKDNRLYYRMGKNKKLVSLKVPQKAQAIMNIYIKDKKKKTDFVFPNLKGVNLKDEKALGIRIKTITRNLNRRLAIVAEQLEIDKKLSMHIARHSFGNIAGDTIPIQMLQKLYRHSSITTTINYQQNFMHKETDDALDKVIGF